MSTLRILTYNTWKCDGNYPQRLQDIRQQLSLIDFDILLLQEVFRSEGGGYDTLAELMHDTPGLDSTFHPGRRKTRRVEGRDLTSVSGLAIISRFNLKQQGAFRLPVATNDPDRYCQWCVIETGRQDLLILNTHLTHINDQHSLRNAQFQALIDFVPAGKHSLALIGGDMNTSPQQLIGNSDLDCVFTTSEPNTLNIGKPQCLDHLYLYASRGVSASWGQHKLLFDQQPVGYFLSNHKAIFAELFLS